MTGLPTVDAVLLALTAVTLFVTYAGWHYRRVKSVAAGFVAGAVLSVAHAVGVSLCLALFGLATPFLTWLVTMLLLGVLAVVARPVPGRIVRSARELVRAGVVRVRRLVPMRVAALPAYAFVLILLFKLITGLLIRPYTCDAHSFHLPVALNILANGRYMDVLTGAPLTDSWHHFMNGYGRNIALIYFWVLAIGRNEAFLTLVSLFSAPVAVAAVYRMCRLSWVWRDASMFAAPLAVFSTFSIIQLNTCMPDQITATLTVAGFMFALERTTRWNTVLLGVVCGLLAGCHRFTVLPAAGVPALLYAVRTLLRRRGHAPTPGGAGVAARWFPWHVVLFGIPLLFFGAYPYVHNWRAFGSPLYPYVTPLLGGEQASLFTAADHVASSYPAALGQSAVRVFVRSVLRVWGTFTHSSRLGGWGLLFPFVMLPAHLVALVLRRRDRTYLLFTGAVWLALVATPQFYWLRYTLFFFMAGAVPVAVCLDTFRRWRTPLALLVTAVGLASAGHAALHVGYRGVMVRSWRRYLSLRSAYERTCFLNPHPSLQTARAIHERGLARDVAYVSTHYKYQFHDKRFSNRVVPCWFVDEASLLRFLEAGDLGGAAIVVKAGTAQDRVLAASDRFRRVYTGRREAVYLLRKAAATRENP